MTAALGFLLIALSGVSDGSFYVPAQYTRKWQWEHYWAVFSVAFGLISWIITLLFIPNIVEILATAPLEAMAPLLGFGALWGVGAILFGTALHLLGMALGYPIALGTVACFGAVVPLLTTERDNLLTLHGAVAMLGVAVAVWGIVICSQAYRIRERSTIAEGSHRPVSLAIGLPVALLAGVFSAMINIGFSFGDPLSLHAESAGVSSSMAPLTLWPLFFTVACVINLTYCLILMAKKRTGRQFFGPDLARNVPLGLLMAALFVGAIYVYSIGATMIGSWGEVPGWVAFMSVDIITGNLWGLKSGEWTGAPTQAADKLKRGMVVIILAIGIVAVSNLFKATDPAASSSPTGAADGETAAKTAPIECQYLILSRGAPKCV